MNGEVIWQASDSPLTKELHAHINPKCVDSRASEFFPHTASIVLNLPPFAAMDRLNSRPTF